MHGTHGRTIVPLLVASTLALGAAGPAGAAPKAAKAKEDKAPEVLAPLPEANAPAPTAEEFARIQSRGQPPKDEKGRFLAHAAIDETSFSEPFRAFRDKQVPAVKTPEQLDQLLDKVNAEYETYPADLKYAVAQLRMLKVFRGILPRVYPLFSRRDIHSTAFLSVVKRLAATVEFELPDPIWNVGWDYVATPNPKGDTPIKKMSELQNLFATEIYPAVEERTRRVTALLNSFQKPIPLDAKLLFGRASFQDNLDRFSSIGTPELLLELAGLMSAQHDIHVFLAYDLRDALEVSYQLGKLWGLDGFLFARQDGVSVKEKRDVAMKYPDYLTLRGAAGKGKERGWYGKAQLERAHSRLYSALQTLDQALIALNRMPDNEYALINPGLYRFYDRKAQARFKNWSAAMGGKADLRSLITGETVTIDLTALYLQPPMDLKAFLPTGFVGGDEVLSFKTARGTVKYHNFNRGRAKAWDLAKFAPYLPGVKTHDDIPKAKRVLNESWGAKSVASLMDMILY